MGTKSTQSSLIWSVDAYDAHRRPSKLNSLAFGLICFLPVLNAVLFGGVDAITWSFIPLIALVVLLSWLKDGWTSGGLVLDTSSLQIPLIGLLIIGLIQLLPLAGASAGSDALGTAASRALSLEPAATRFMVVRLAVDAIFFGGCLTLINSEKRLRRTILLVILFGSFMAFYGILQRLVNPDGIYGLRETPQAVPFGPFVNQHHFAAFMEMTCGVTAGMFFGGVEGREKKLLLAFAAVLMAVSIVWTGSRGGLIGFISSIALLTAVNFFFSRDDRTGRQKFVVVISLAALICVVLGTVLFLGGADQLLRGAGINNPSGDLTTGRSHYWSVAIKIFLEHPILGAGLDAFGVAYTRLDSWNGALRVEQAHNDYLQSLTDAGIIGLGCVVAFIYLLFKKATGVISSSEGFRRAGAAGALAGCFGVMIHSFFDFPLRTPSNAFFFLMLSAIATVPIALEERSHRRRKHKRES